MPRVAPGARRLVTAVAVVTLAACGGSSGPPAAGPTTPAPTTAKPKPKLKPKKTPSVSPTPTVTTPPPPSGQPMTATGAFLVFVEPGQPVRVGSTADCRAGFPDLAAARCGAVEMDAGTLFWGAGTKEGRKVVRLLTKDASGGYVARYEGTEGATRWGDPRVLAAPVIGPKPDGVGVVVPLAGGAATYDVLTWVKGGPLVLRAHRSAIPDGRLGPVEGGLAEYLHQADGAWVMRRVAWDGRQFLLGGGARVPASAVPPR